MSLPQTLDEWSTQKLCEELARRCGRMEQGRCPYCNTPLLALGDGPICRCKFGDQIPTYHNHTYIRLLTRWIRS